MATATAPSEIRTFDEYLNAYLPSMARSGNTEEPRDFGVRLAHESLVAAASPPTAKA